jgi:hAT family C-terminal dimerisation region
MDDQQPTSTNEMDLNDKIEEMALQEMDKWEQDISQFQLNSNNTQYETIFEFWERQKERYPIRASLAIHAIPLSSCELERDFGIAGNLLSKNRSSMSNAFIDMSLFCNRNKIL